MRMVPSLLSFSFLSFFLSFLFGGLFDFWSCFSFPVSRTELWSFTCISAYHVRVCVGYPLLCCFCAPFLWSDLLRATL